MDWREYGRTFEWIYTEPELKLYDLPKDEWSYLDRCMSLEDNAVYVFVRGDLAEEDQMVQACHVVLELGMSHTQSFAKYRMICLDGGSSQKAFNKTQKKLLDKGIGYLMYTDTDHPEWGVTAIATTALTKEQALPLAKYRLRKFTPSSERARPNGGRSRRFKSYGVSQFKCAVSSN